MMQCKKPSSMWAQYSMFKSTLKIYDRVDIEKYASLTAILKQNSHGYEPIQAKTFTDSEARQFLDNEPDDMWLDVKVALVFGICGCCLSYELPSIQMEYIKRYDDMYYVEIPKTNSKIEEKRIRCHRVTGGHRSSSLIDVDSANADSANADSANAGSANAGSANAVSPNTG
ncbi:hypothetical protein HA402_004323 [Bradysia odoriphaga]|nr:hypothetical protein HA402_004323 [Bradysia odoriphaga]